jgi:tetratricopeptide (TPR) repeat protein
MYLRSGRLIEGLALRDAARSATLSVDRRLELVQNFLQLGWNDFARLEANAILAADDPSMLREQVTAHLVLNEIADIEENDAAAIEHLRQATTLMEKGQLMINGDPQLMAASIPGQIAWRTARIASAKSNAAEVKKALDEVVNLSPTGSDVVLNTYPLLIKAGRNADATEMFNRVYTLLKTNLETIREDRKPQLQNNLAWFLARCNQKLEEARDASMQAVAAEPGNAAYIDTLAEIQFRLGNAEEAVKLETKALLFRPDDEFMHRQIERFRTGTVKKP